MPRPKQFRSSKTQAPVIPPKGSTISIIKPQFVPQDEPADEPVTVPDVPAVPINSASEKPAPEKSSKKRSRAQSESQPQPQPSKKKPEIPLPPPQDLLPPTLRTDVEKRLGSDFWDRDVKAPYTGGSAGGRTDALKRWLTLDPKCEGSADTVLACSASGVEALKIISPLEQVVRGCGPQGGKGEEVVVWWKYESLGSVVVEIKRGEDGKKKKVEQGRAQNGRRSKKSKKNSAEVPDYEISIDGDSESDFEGFGEQGGVGLETAKEEIEEEEPAFESMDVDGKAKKQDIDPSKPKLRANPVLTIWLSRKSIPEFKEAFGEKIVKVFKWKADEDVTMT